MTFLFFALMNTPVYLKALSLSYHTTVIIKQLIPLMKAHFLANVIHEITLITDALKKECT